MGIYKKTIIKTKKNTMKLWFKPVKWKKNNQCKHAKYARKRRGQVNEKQIKKSLVSSKFNM
jgi:hypothetical protein